MAALAAAAPYFFAASAVLGVVGQTQAGRGARAAGQRKRVAAEFEAAQIDQAAGQVFAASQRTALEEERQSKFIQSRALALAAASGAGAGDVTVKNIIARTEANGAYRAAVALYKGEEQARQMKLQAIAKRFEGQIAEQGGADEASARNTMALGGLVGSGATFFSKYGAPGRMTTTEPQLISEMSPGQYDLNDPRYG